MVFCCQTNKKDKMRLRSRANETTLISYVLFLFLRGKFFLSVSGECECAMCVLVCAGMHVC